MEQNSSEAVSSVNCFRLRLFRLLARLQELSVSKFISRRNVDGFFDKVSTLEGLVSIFSQYIYIPNI